MTLYADGADFARDSKLVDLIITLLRFNLQVAIVTAAGYPGNPARYEQRLSGLLDGFKTSDLSPEQLSRFYVLGGECNYLFQYTSQKGGLVYIPEDTYQPENVKKWSNNEKAVAAVLDIAETTFKSFAKEAGISDWVTIYRKPKAIGNACIDFRDSLQRHEAICAFKRDAG
jgi:IMP and pyridine-specific 5'-nucleotidase